MDVMLLLRLFAICASSISLARCAAPDCGRRKLKLQQLVTHGYSTNPGEYPWHAALFMATGFKKSYICGGTLVNELNIVTAAHCVIDPATGSVLSPATVYVQLGKFKLNLYSDKVQEHAVQQIIMNENFQMATSKYDIAVLKLATQVKFTDYVQPICVFPQPDIHYSNSSIKGVVVGWGYTEFDTLSDALRGTTVPLVSHTKCLESNPDLFDRTIYEGMFCAGYRNGTNVCNGDSGGGLFYNQNNVWYLVGIVSFTAARQVDTNLCSTQDYTGFTKIAAFEEFIVKHTGLVAAVAIPAKGHKRPGAGGAGRRKHFLVTDFASEQKLNWFQAADFCRSVGQHLGEINSDQENTKLREMVVKGGVEIDIRGEPRLKQYWIGANDLGVRRVFRWQFSGKPVQYENWRHNELENSNHRENCVAVLGNKHASWIIANCKGKKQVVCETHK